MTSPTPTLADFAASGAVPPSDFSQSPERIREIVNEHLRVPVPLQEIVDRVMTGGLYRRSDVEECVASLLNGHLLLAGPPGTGKTQLARVLATTFNALLREETANPEWSVYDTIGSLALPGAPVPYRDGIVTTSIIDCANRIVANLDTGDFPQATWLLIDEINRAEIDRAFGPLFTALSSSSVGTFVLDHRDGAPVIPVPKRFRIIATMNSYDTRFVNTLSAALRRRFARVSILPPANEQGLSSLAEGELALRHADTLGAKQFDRPMNYYSSILEPHLDDMRAFFGALRALDDFGGIPIGTAQVIDTLALLVTLIEIVGQPFDQGSFFALFDRALSGRIMSSVESDATRLRIKEGYVTALAQRFPLLPQTTGHLAKFLGGID